MQERGKSVAFFCAFCELIQACTQVKTLTKPPALLTYHLALFNPASVGQQVLVVTFLTAPCLPLFSFADCVLLCLAFISVDFLLLSFVN